MQLSLEPEPGEPVPLWEPSDDPPWVTALFDQHLFALTEPALHLGEKLVYVDMSSGVPGDLQQISPGRIFLGKFLYSAAGDTVVWIDFPYPTEQFYGRLWRIDFVDGVPLPAVELTGPGEWCWSTTMTAAWAWSRRSSAEAQLYWRANGSLRSGLLLDGAF